jgi:hypothetical protein
VVAGLTLPQLISIAMMAAGAVWIVRGDLLRPMARAAPRTT